MNTFQMPCKKHVWIPWAESIKDYQIRRVRWAARLLDHRGESVDRWKVIRLAGLTPGNSKNVEDVLDSEVEGRHLRPVTWYVLAVSEQKDWRE